MATASIGNQPSTYLWPLSLQGSFDTISLSSLRIESETLATSFEQTLRFKYTIKELICHNKEIYWSDRLKWKAIANKLWPTKPKSN